MSIFMKTITVRLYHVDAAGLLFFAQQFCFAHETYEDFLLHLHFPVRKILEEEGFLLPIVHAESQYFRPLAVGDQVDIALKVADIGEHSFTLEYEFAFTTGESAGRAKTVHVTVDGATRKKIPLPGRLREALASFQSAP